MLLLMSLPACGQGGRQPGAELGAVGDVRDGFTVGLLLPGEGPDRPLFTRALSSLCPRCYVQYANAAGDRARQGRQIGRMLADGVRVLVLGAVDPEAAAPWVARAKLSGAKVVAYDRLANGPVDAYVATDPARVGREQALALLGALKGAGPVLLLNGPATDPYAATVKRALHAVLDGRVRIGWERDLTRPDEAVREVAAAVAALGGAAKVAGVCCASDAVAEAVAAEMARAGMAGGAADRAWRAARGPGACQGRHADRNRAHRRRGRGVGRRQAGGRGRGWQDRVRHGRRVQRDDGFDPGGAGRARRGHEGHGSRGARPRECPRAGRPPALTRPHGHARPLQARATAGHGTRRRPAASAGSVKPFSSVPLSAGQDGTLRGPAPKASAHSWANQPRPGSSRAHPASAQPRWRCEAAWARAATPSARSPSARSYVIRRRPRGCASAGRTRRATGAWRRIHLPTGAHCPHVADTWTTAFAMAGEGRSRGSQAGTADR
ncbi:hypothetical protein B1L11_10665 [Microbispora sp. GKU 823]|nr:hypothetical protein B1L11_10665 [Microbispora sp. GKU 823]